jgi:hypothetical protein
MIDHAVRGIDDPELADRVRASLEASLAVAPNPWIAPVTDEDLWKSALTDGGDAAVRDLLPHNIDSAAYGPALNDVLVPLFCSDPWVARNLLAGARSDNEADPTCRWPEFARRVTEAKGNCPATIAQLDDDDRGLLKNFAAAAAPEPSPTTK